MKLTPEQIDIIRHTLGCDQFGNGEYRNYFAAGQTGKDHQTFEEFVGLGIAVKNPRFPSEISGGSDVYHITGWGKDLFLSQCPKPLRKTRAQLKYEKWIEEDSGRTFAEFLGIKRKQKV